jgi:hypothetical protein
MLSFWKVLVRRSLTNWIATRHPNIKTPSVQVLVCKMPKQGRGHIRWRRYDWAQESNKLRSLKFTGEVTWRFTWAKEGLKIYKAWWQARMKAANWDLVPGINAVARGANSSWFEWDDGSRPLHRRVGPRFIRRLSAMVWKSILCLKKRRINARKQPPSAPV